MIVGHFALTLEPAIVVRFSIIAKEKEDLCLIVDILARK